ncbi:MAG: acyltransferase family protein [Proteobacteria bacterium]|nr:acyltransferase family protein [Pseudomonadota bacterium]
MKTSMKIPRTAPADHRIFFFDNLRYFLVLLVVLFHSIASYNNLSDWWTVNDDNFLFFDSVLILLDVFMMPGLFFIAGYFALQSHQGQTTRGFIKKKFNRLGIPWLIGVILVNPVQIYIWNLSCGQSNPGLWHYFVFKIKSALSFYTGLVNLSVQYDQFIQLHYWFINLLFCFFVIFAITKKIKDTLLSKPSVLTTSEPASRLSIFLILFFSGVLIFVFNILIYGLFPIITIPNTWVVIGNLIQFQASRILLYSVCFFLGIYAYHKNWFLAGRVPGHLILWVLTSAILGHFLHETTFSLLKEASKTKAILYTLLHPMFFFSILLTLISLGVRYWNSASKFNRLMAENSYTIYLVHLVFVFIFQLILKDLTAIPVYMKAVIVFILSTGISLLISHFAINKSPRLSAAGIIVIFILGLIVLK